MKSKLPKLPKLIVPEYLTNRFVPNLESTDLLEYFLIAAVTSLLVIRAFLNITGFPQLGGEGFHIAHMLWGGLLMLVSLTLFVSFINSGSKVVAVIFGGVGFGAFIDELGKFITSDNDYFYKPTIAIVYLIFVGIFLFIRYLSTITTYSSKTYVVNAIEILKEIVISDMDKNERAKALEYLEKSNQDDPIANSLQKFIENEVPKETRISFIGKIIQKFISWYRNLIKIRLVARSIIVFFVISATLGIFSSSIRLLVGIPDFAEIGSFVSSLVVGVLTILGVYHYRKKNLSSAYVNLIRAAIFAIFVTQFFNFLQNELSAIFWLGLYVSVYFILKGTVKNQAGSSF